MQETLTIKAPTMAEYIKKEAVLDLFGEVPAYTGYETYPVGVHTLICEIAPLIKDEIRKIPAADVAPVRHGHWEWFEEWSPSTPESPKECIDCGWRCGRCKVKLDDMVGWYWDDPYDEPKLNYCPNCGMRADE